METTLAPPSARVTGRTLRRISWLLQLIPAFILGQTLVFKFAGAEEAVALFEKLGAEPWGRYGTSAMELVAVALLLIPGKAAWGALLTLGLMAGAVGTHLTLLGIDVDGDGGALFGMAVTALLCAAGVAWIRRSELPWIGHRFSA